MKWLVRHLPMVRKDREDLIALCIPGSSALDREELMFDVLQLANYCSELELEISRMCNTCSKCKFAHDGNGICNNWIAGKSKHKREAASAWNDWFG